MTIRNDQYLHRPTAGRGAVKPDDPLEVRLYGPDGKPIGVQDDALKVALSGSFVPYITSQVLAESLEVAAGATVVLPGHHQVLCEYITVGVLQVGSSNSGNLTVIVRPLMEAGWVLSKDVKAIDNVPMNNLRWLSDRVPVLADRVVIALQNHASVTRTFKVILYRLGVGANA